MRCKIVDLDNSYNLLSTLCPPFLSLSLIISLVTIASRLDVPRVTRLCPVSVPPVLQGQSNALHLAKDFTNVRLRFHLLGFMFTGHGTV